jgi:hypothetical protein
MITCDLQNYSWFTIAEIALSSVSWQQHPPSRFPLAFSINHIQEAFLLGSHCCQLSHHDSQTVTRFENPKTASSSQGIGSCSESKPVCFAEDRKEKGDVSSVVQGRQ